MVIVYIWRGRGSSSSFNAGHASLVVTNADGSARTVCTWFPNNDPGKSRGLGSSFVPGRHSSGSGSSGGSSSGSSGSGGSSGPSSGGPSSGSSGGSASKGDATRSFPRSPSEEWGAFMFREGARSQLDRVTAFAQAHPTDPIAQRAATSALNTQMFPPSDSVQIRTLSDENSFTGLSEMIIRAWWDQYTNNNQHYHLINRNCSTITASALIAGGGTDFASTPTGSGAFWTPEKAFSFAKDIKKAVDETQQKCVLGANRLAAIPGIPSGAAVGDVWTRDEWYRASEANVSFIARRYKLLEDIDKMLSFYHDTLLPEELPADFKSEMIIEHLSLIEAKLYQILAERDGSKHKDAIGRLGAQCHRKKRAEQRAIEDRRAAAELAAQREREVADLVARYVALQTKFDQLGPDARNSIRPRVRHRAVRISEELDVLRLQIEAARM